MNDLIDCPSAVRGRTGDYVQLLTGAQSRLYAYICCLVGESAAARDVLQETNLALWDKAGEYDPERPVLALGLPGRLSPGAGLSQDLRPQPPGVRRGPGQRAWPSRPRAATPISTSGSRPWAIASTSCPARAAR